MDGGVMMHVFLHWYSHVRWYEMHEQMHEQVDILTHLFLGACAMRNEYVLVNNPLCYDECVF